MPSSFFKQSETALKNAIVKLLRSHGIFCWRAGAGPYAPAGVSDILACRNGQLIAIEAKVSKNTLTRLQRKFLDDVIQAGGMAFVTYDIDFVKDVLGL